MIPLLFPLKNKDHPSKPTINAPTKGREEGAEENAPEFEDSESEDEEYEGEHI